MLNEKISITQQIRDLILDARNQVGLTASDLSDKIKGSIYWLPNIENGRTKSILKSDLISILVLTYKCSDDEAESMIVNALNNSSISSSDLDLDLDEKEVRFYKGEDVNLEDISKYQQAYEDATKDIVKGFNLLFEKYGDKKDALDTIKTIQRNLHSDLGFMIALYSLPWCKISALTVDQKKKIMKDMYELIKTNGSCDNCRAKSKKNNNCND